MDPVARFDKWMEGALKGEQYIYWCGSLSDAQSKHQPARDIARRVRGSYELGNVTLVQRKFAPYGFEYIAVRL